MTSERTLRRHVERALARDDLGAALALLSDAVREAIAARDETMGIVFGLRAADALCARVGARALARRRRAPPPARAGERPPLDVFVASELSLDGGHTAVIGDFVRAAPGRKHLLLITDATRRCPDLDEPVRRRTGLAADEVAVCGARSPLGQLEWLIDRLADHRPERLFLFHYPFDAAAVAAAQPGLSAVTCFVHHVDRYPCLGVFAPGVRHVDLTPFSHHYCRRCLGIEDGVYLPLGCADFGVRLPPEEGPLCGPLTTASSGAERKFDPSYRYPYPAVMASLLAATGGRHVHIGPLSSEARARMRAALDERGVAAERFLHVPHVWSVWRALGEYGVDLYVNSFPQRGARATVEVMGSGTPAVWHLESSASFLHDTHMRYPEAPTWQTPEELVALVRRIDGTWLRAQARSARQHWEATHDWRAPDIAAFLTGASDTAREPPPADGFVVAAQVARMESWREELLEARATIARLRRREARRPGAFLRRWLSPGRDA